ncbi:WD40 repeat-like protein [Heliocybe sulcata]|uniref:WD40 repeat-like protein n=1 Tax=Heliocybe sulcata TaxID=5364 RepID=A0A5C3MTW3_9AGAM|nr:WD40 repeat-like protein [Heliocybe sulcata]
MPTDALDASARTALPRRDDNNAVTFLVVMEISVEHLPIVHKKPKAFVRIRAGNDFKDTGAVKVKSSSLRWQDGLYIADLSAASSVAFELYYQKWWLWKTCMGSVERPLKDVRGNKTFELRLPSGSYGVNVNPVVHVHCFSDYEAAVGALIDSQDANVEGANSRISAVEEAADKVQSTAQGSSDTWASLAPMIDNIQPFKDLFDEIAKVHPISVTAWGLLSIAWTVLQSERTRTKKVLALRQSMISVYSVAREKNKLKELDEFKELFRDLMKQTMECALFLSQYFSNGFFRRLTDTAADQKIREFTLAFQDFRDRFRDTALEKVTVVSVGCYQCLQRLERRHVLQRLHPHSQTGMADARCLNGTREEYIDRALRWFSQEHGSILWLTGPLGSGKTTLAFTIADRVMSIGPRGRLGAFILFRRDGSLGLRDPYRFVTTLAYKLAEFDDRIGDAIANAVQVITDLDVLSAQEQFRQLIVAPLLSIRDLENDGPIMVLVDALDECAPGQGREVLLKDVISMGFGAGLDYIRFIVTSRPTNDISAVMNPMKNSKVRSLWLDVQSEESMRDIRLYFDHRLKPLELREQDIGHTHAKLVQELSNRSGGLFIWATLTYRFIEGSPVKRIKVVLDDPSQSSPDTDERLRAMYQHTLTQLLGEGNQADIQKEMHTFIGAIVMAHNPPGMTRNVVAGLYGDRRLSDDTFDRLKSLISSDDSQPVRFLHKSFYEYIEEAKLSGSSGWHVDANACHKELVLLSFSHLRDWHPRDNADDHRQLWLDMPHLAYAFRYWMYHLTQMSNWDNDIFQGVNVFFRQHYLNWIHAVLISWKSESDLAYNAIIPLGGVVSSYITFGLDAELCQHALAFLRHISGHPTVSKNISLLYTAGLESAPRTNRIRQIYLGLEPEEFSQLCHHTGSVWSALFSPDGQYIASASHDGTVQVWDSTTGALRYFPLNLGGDVYAVAFSATGDRIVSGDSQGHVFVWDAATGEKLIEVPAHEDDVNAVAFSPDGKSIASGSGDRRIILWNARTGQATVGPLHGHRYWVWSVAFSPDGTLLASGSRDETIQIWDTSTGEPVGEPLHGHESDVMSISFSPDGTCLASGSGDKTIRIWSVATGEAIGTPLAGHHDTVTSVAFSPEGTRLASASADETIGIWDVATRSTILGPLTGHTNWIYSVAWSPDGRRIVSGSRDCTVRVWDALTGGVLFSSKGQTESDSVVFIRVPVDGSYSDEEHCRYIRAGEDGKL